MIIRTCHLNTISSKNKNPYNLIYHCFGNNIPLCAGLKDLKDVKDWSAYALSILLT